MSYKSLQYMRLPLKPQGANHVYRVYKEYIDDPEDDSVSFLCEVEGDFWKENRHYFFTIEYLHPSFLEYASKRGVCPSYTASQGWENFKTAVHSSNKRIDDIVREFDLPPEAVYEMNVERIVAHGVWTDVDDWEDRSQLELKLRTCVQKRLVAELCPNEVVARMLASCKTNSLEHASFDARDDVKVVMQARPDDFKHATRRVKNQKEVVMRMCSLKASCLQFAGKKWKGKPQVAIAALGCEDSDERQLAVALKHVSKKLLDNGAVILEACAHAENTESVLKLASERLTSNPRFVAQCRKVKRK